MGVLIRSFNTATETFKDRYRLADEGELECYDCGEDFRTCNCNSEHQDYKKEDITPEGKVWDDFTGDKKSKLFGIFTYCQWSKEEIEETMVDEVVLFQIGENGFNDEGVFTISIPTGDLEKRNFDNCKCYWGQT